MFQSDSVSKKNFNDFYKLVALTCPPVLGLPSLMNIPIYFSRVKKVRSEKSQEHSKKSNDELLNIESEKRN